MEDQLFLSTLKEIIDIFALENYSFAIQKANKLYQEINNPEDKIFLQNIINIIKAADLINHQEIEEALKLLENAYHELKKFRPNYKGLKIENLLNSVNQSIIDLKLILKNSKSK